MKYVLWNDVSVPLLCSVLLQHLEPLLVNKGTGFTAALYCHRFGSRDVIGHVTIRSTVCGFLYRWSIVTNPLSCVVTEILCVLLDKHIPVVNVFHTYFGEFGEHLGFSVTHH